MRVTVGPYASYIYLKEGQSNLKTKELTDGVYLDYNENGEIVGIEILERLEVEEN